MLMVFSPLQPSKAPLFIVVTEFGMLMVFSPLQPKKALNSIVFTEFGMLMVFSPLQPSKASSLIVVTEFGMLYSPVLPFGHRISFCRDLLKSTPSEEEK